MSNKWNKGHISKRWLINFNLISGLQSSNLYICFYCYGYYLDKVRNLLLKKWKEAAQKIQTQGVNWNRK